MSEEVTVQERINTLEDRVHDLQDQVNLRHVRDIADDLRERIEELPGKIQEMRSRGYQFRSFLENQAEVLKTQWQSLADRVYDRLGDAARDLQSDFDDVQQRLNRLRAAHGDAGEAPAASGAGSSLGSAGDAPAKASKAEKQRQQGRLQSASKGQKTLGDLAKSQGQQRKLQGPKRTGSPIDKATAQSGDAGGAIGAIGAIDAVERLVDQLEARIDSIADDVRDDFYKLTQNTGQVDRHLREINWTMDQVEEATFDWLAGETPVIVAEAEWNNQSDNPDGVLYLSNQRLIFEQKEKKGGFLGFGGKKVQNILWEVPVHKIAKAVAHQEGMLGRKDMIDLSLEPGASYGQLVFEVKGSADNTWWIRQINRACTDDLRKEQVGVSQEEAAAEVDLSEVPSACPNCGASLPEVTRSAKQITCEYCYTVIRF